MKATALILLKLLINGHKRCHTIDAPPPSYHISRTLFSVVNKIQFMISEDQKNITTKFTKISYMKKYRPSLSHVP